MDADEKYYSIVGRELQEKQLKPSLWARAVAETRTEGTAARARYIALRLEDLAEIDRCESEQRKEAARRETELKAQEDPGNLRVFDGKSRALLRRSIVVLIIVAIIVLIGKRMFRSGH